MSDEPLEEIDDAIDDTSVEAKPASRKRKLIIGIAAALAVLGGGGAAGYMMLGTDDAVAETDSAEPPVYVEVPPMTVNLRSADGQARFLKLRFVLVAAEAGQEEAIVARMPLILDAYQPFLRELRPDDLAGSAAVYRLKEEMLLRATEVAGPDVIKDVLIQDLIQQ